MAEEFRNTIRGRNQRAPTNTATGAQAPSARPGTRPIIRAPNRQSGGIQNGPSSGRLTEDISRSVDDILNSMTIGASRGEREAPATTRAAIGRQIAPNTASVGQAPAGARQGEQSPSAPRPPQAGASFFDNIFESLDALQSGAGRSFRPVEPQITGEPLSGASPQIDNFLNQISANAGGFTPFIRSDSNVLPSPPANQQQQAEPPLTVEEIIEQMQQLLGAERPRMPQMPRVLQTMQRTRPAPRRETRPPSPLRSRGGPGIGPTARNKFEERGRSGRLVGGQTDRGRTSGTTNRSGLSRRSRSASRRTRGGIRTSSTRSSNSGRGGPSRNN